MPSPNFSPTTAVLTEFDARDWSGVVVFSRGGTDVTLPSFAAGAGLYEDALSFLNGRGSQPSRDLAAELSLSWSLGGSLGTVTCGIDSSDLFYIESDTEDFSLAVSAGNPFGLVSAGLVGGAAPFRHTATSPWTRGTLTVTAGAISMTTATAGIQLAPIWPAQMQDLVVALRKSGVTADADDSHAADSLEYLDNEELDDANHRIRWGINSAGHVYCSIPTSASIAAPTWSSTTFRDRLGFSGNESIVAASSIDTLTADYPLPGAVVPQEWGLVTVRPETREVSHTVELIGGGIASNHVALFNGWDVRFHIDGPAYSTDLEDHTVRQFLPYARLGRGCNVYPEWGDSRRNLPRYGVTASQEAYDLLYCHNARPLGRRGRIRGRIGPQSPTDRTHTYDDDIDARHELRLRLRDRVD